MMWSLSPPALANLLLAAGLAAVGTSGIVGSIARLPSQATVAALERGLMPGGADVERARTDLEAATAASNGARIDLGFVLLAGQPHGPDADEAAREFRAYLAEVPGDSRAWAGLAQAELLQNHRSEALSALKVSILTAPSSPGILLWRCGIGIDLYESLDEEGRRLVGRQFRMAAERSPARLVRLVREKNAVLTALVLLTPSPGAMQQFTAQLARMQR
jgi:hypothetical protein